MKDVLIATDADWIHEEVIAALGSDGTTVRWVRTGKNVFPAVLDTLPDLVVLDGQIGNMGGMSTCHNLRLEEGVATIPRLPVLLLLDRVADVFLAQQVDADGWLIKPLDSFRLRRAAAAVTEGGRYEENYDPAATRTTLA